MQYIDTLFIYAISCSTLLVYGIGLEKVFFETHPYKTFTHSIPSFFLETIITITSVWFFSTKFLLPLGLISLVPISVILICGIVHSFIQIIIPHGSQQQAGEQLFFFGTILLSVFEADSYIDSLLIVCGSLLSFTIFTFILFSIRERMASGHPHTDWKGAPLILVSMGLLCIVLYTADISWWLSEAVR